MQTLDPTGGTESRCPTASTRPATQDKAAAQARQLAARYWFLPVLAGAGYRHSCFLYFIFDTGVAWCIVDRGDQQAAPVAVPLSRSLPFEAAAFDGVFACSTAGSAPALAGVVERLAHIVRPGGVLVCACPGLAGRLATARLALAERDTAAMAPYFIATRTLYTLPGLRRPSLLLTSAELLGAGSTGELVTPHLSRPTRLLAQALARPSIVRRLSSRLVLWTRTARPLGEEHNSHGASQLHLSAAAPPWLASDVDLALYTDKPRRAAQRAFAVIGAQKRSLAVVKFSREPDAKLAHEHWALARVHQLLASSPLRATIPAWWFRHTNVFAYEHRAGHSLQALFSPLFRPPLQLAEIRPLLQGATDWLVAFQQATRLPSTAPASGIPLGPVHGDFQPANILMQSNGAVSVIDWEQFEERQPITHDVLNLFTYVGLFYEPRRALREACDRLFFVRTPLGELLRGVLQAYCRAMQIPAGELRRAYDDFLAWRSRRRVAEGLTNEAHYLTGLSDFFACNAAAATIFDLDRE
ncbi:MAG: hypothetical protein HY699_13205 [Deltaproteobacteria bacterium]|nr:hypothetical protein [Deltaproteobacteria bacterium]